MSMLQGVCPFCQSTEIYIKHDDNNHHIIKIDVFSGFRPVLFVCTNCGYMAHFVAREHLQDIRNKWHKWDPNNRYTLLNEKRKNDEQLYDIDEPEFVNLDSDEFEELFSDEKPKRKPKRKHKRKNDEL